MESPFQLWKIKELADKKNLSIRKLAQKAGLSDSAVHEMIKRNAANPLNVRKIAIVLGVDLSELVNLENEILTSGNSPKNSVEKVGGQIPLISSELLLDKMLTEILNTIHLDRKYNIPGINDADFLLNMPGYAMEGDFNPGDVLICKHITNENAKIAYGNAYIMETDGGLVIRRIMPHEDSSKLNCISPNAKFPAFEIDKSAVLSYSKILGYVRVE